MNARRYSEEEAAAILSRAAELSERTSPTKGVTLDELERIAQEAGLDPASVRSAAASLNGPVEGKPSIWRALFGPLSINFDVELDGELDDKGREEVLEAISRTLGEAPQVGSVGRVLTVSVARQGRNLQCVVSSLHGRTRIRIEERLGQMAGGIYGGVGGGVGGSIIPLACIGAGVAAGPIAAIAAGIGTTALALGGSRAIYNAVVARRTAGIQRVFDEVRAVAEARVRPVPVEGADSSLDGSLDRARERQGLAPAPERALASAERREVVSVTEPRSR